MVSLCRHNGWTDVDKSATHRPPSETFAPSGIQQRHVSLKMDVGRTPVSSGGTFAIPAGVRVAGVNVTRDADGGISDGERAFDGAGGRPLRVALLVAVVYLLLGILSVSFAQHYRTSSYIWLPSAVAVAMLIRIRPGAIWPSLCGVFVAALAIQLFRMRDPVFACVISLGSVVNVGVATTVILRTTRLGTRPTLLLALWILFATSVIGPVAASCLIVPSLAAITGRAWHEVWILYLATTAWAAGVVMPVAVTVDRTALKRLVDGRSALIFLAALVTGAVVTAMTASLILYPFAVLAVPILLAALWFDAFRTAIFGAVMVAVVIVMQAFNLTAGLDPVLRYISAAMMSVLPFLIALQRDTVRESEQAARHSEARFRHAMMDSAIGMAIVGLDGRLLQSNDALREMLGYSEAELHVLSFRQITHPADLALDVENFYSLLAGERDTYRIEKRYIRKDGRAIWTFLAVSLVRDDATGEPQYFLSQIEDIDERKRAVELLSASESRWQFALEGAGQGVWDREEASGCTYYSPIWKKMLGYGEAELEDGTFDWMELIHPDDIERVRAVRDPVLNHGPDRFELEFRMRHKSGGWVWILDRGRVLKRDKTGRAIRIIGTHTDITQRHDTAEAMRNLSERIQLAASAAELGIFEVDLTTRRIVWDERMCELYGVAPGCFAGGIEEWERRVLPEDLDHARKVAQSAERFTSEYRIVRDDGAVRHVRTMARIVPGQAGQPAKLVGAQWDTTDQHALTDALHEEKERLRITLMSIGDAVICTDADARVTFMNPIAEQLTGWSQADAVGRPSTDIFSIVNEMTDEPAPDPVMASLQYKMPASAPEGSLLVSRHGERFSVHDSSAPVCTATGEIIGAVLIFQDVTVARALQRELTHAAAHDALTGLPNRAAFETVLHEASASAAAAGRCHAVGYIDLDRFKIVNDTAGHAAGDMLLREVGRLLKEALRPDDVVARFGGDEFAVLLHDCTLVEAEAVCQRAIDAIRVVRFPWEGKVYDIGASIGLTEIGPTSAPPDELMKQVDVACYAAKAGGRNRVAAYSAEAGDARRYYQEIQIAAGIRAAIDEGRFKLFAQEIRAIDPDRGRDRHYEILLRMVDESGALIPPGSFIPAAERYDLMGIIDRWVISTLLRAHRDDMRLNRDLSFSVNLSANSLNDPHLWAFVQNEMLISGIRPGRLQFEITETALINNFGTAKEFVSAARATGAKVGLDDFGAGLSSFSYLKQFQVDCIKIDGAFIRHVDDNLVDRRIVESINDIGHALGMVTVAEFVETEAILNTVREIGIDMAQGYFLGKPTPLTEVFDRHVLEHAREASSS